MVSKAFDKSRNSATVYSLSSKALKASKAFKKIIHCQERSLRDITSIVYKYVQNKLHSMQFTLLIGGILENFF